MGYTVSEANAKLAAITKESELRTKRGRKGDRFIFD